MPDYLNILRQKASRAFSANPEIIAAGIAVQAQDTGRLLMVQRFLTPEDPASGKWEFPGGTLDPGENPIDAAVREWQEETGHKFPADGEWVGQWISSNQVYKGFIYRVPSEQDIEINLDHEDRHALNPDDPDGDNIEVIAWWSPSDLVQNPAIRDELKDTDWLIFRIFQDRTEFSNDCHSPDSGKFCETHGVTDRAKHLNLPEGKYAVAGSAWWDIKGIRKSTDLDIVVTPDVYAQLEKAGWETIHHPHFDSLSHYDDKTGWVQAIRSDRPSDTAGITPDLHSWIKNADVVDGVPIVKLEELYKLKKAYNRPKDQTDIKAMDAVLKKERKADVVERFNSRLIEFYNKCHDESTGKFCEDPVTKKQVKIEKASQEEIKAAKAKAKAWVRIAKVPSQAEVAKGRANAEKAKQGKSHRTTTEDRGGSAEARRQQRQNLFKEFGGEKRGYVIDHQSGIKMHWTDDPAINPNQYPMFTRGRIFTGIQGGGYTLDNLLPESFETNRKRGSRPIRKENL